jgi:hypothetical protein
MLLQYKMIDGDEAQTTGAGAAAGPAAEEVNPKHGYFSSRSGSSRCVISHSSGAMP